ncbi:MAG: HlyD family efflux transporter periplasmic adaptor subunit [Eubacteriales bacterium]|nr:HlyD family efflux transporter periplasmic adaptor subunit [Eubacteriales bacterium]
MSENKVVSGRRKAGKKKVIAVSLVGVLIAGGIGGAVYYRKNSAVRMPEETKKAQSAAAELGSISNTIVGTGNLALTDAQCQTIPSGIEIEEVLVESGDLVKKGDTIATVSKASVLKAVEETQEEIGELDDQISECQEDDDTETIDASVDGRVKLIHAAAGDDVTDVMLENDSLLILSLDGKMAVDIKTSGLEEGDTVTVTLSSGTQVTGTVQTVSGSTCTVTVTDNGTVYDDEVTVTDSDGKELGTGNLYIHEPLKVTGTTGTVSAVNISENESVTSGTTLITLENSEGQVQYEQLLAQREAYSATLKKLLQLSKNQKITADISGTVQSVNVSAGSSGTDSDSSSGNSGGVSTSKMSYTTSSASAKSVGRQNVGSAGSDNQAGIIRLSSATMSVINCSSVSESEPVDTEEAVEFVEESEDRFADDSNENNSGENNPGEDNSDEKPETTVLTLKISTEGQSTADTLAVTAPATGGTPTGEIAAADGSYTGNINWNPGDSSFQENTVYQANVTLYAGEGYSFADNSISAIDTGVVSGMTVSADGSTVTFVITYPQTAKKTDSGNSGKDNLDDNSEDGKENGANGATDGESDKMQSGNGSSTDDSNQTSENKNSNQSGTSQNGNSSGNQAGTAGSGGSSGTADLTSSAYSTDVEAFTISSDENMVLAVSVDELDINSVEIGQEAVVELDAIEDETFTGEVTAIGDTASASGGVAKYTVSLTIPKDDRMKQGMNASATITIDSRENVVTIPVNALQEEGSKVFVYTEQDDDGNLSGEKEVTTGLSDGTTVEITDGLEEGETVYYNKTGNTQNNNSSSDGFQGGGSDGGNGGPGGDMPSGGGGDFGGGNGGRGGSSQGGGPGGMPNM